jgi:hypothetical protein
MRGDRERAPWGGEAGGYGGFLEGDAVEDGAAAEVGLERAESYLDLDERHQRGR